MPTLLKRLWNIVTTVLVAAVVLLAVLLVAGWFGVRKRVHAIHSTAPTLKQ